MGSLIATFEHTEMRGKESWIEEREGVVRVDFAIPGYSPSKGSYLMSSLQALRQFALMTSVEGWFLQPGTEGLWHGWASKQNVDGVMEAIETEFEYEVWTEEKRIEARLEGWALSIVIEHDMPALRITRIDPAKHTLFKETGEEPQKFAVVDVPAFENDQAAFDWVQEEARKDTSAGFSGTIHQVAISMTERKIGLL